MRIYRNIDQRTEEWHELRKGKVTGTLLGKILSSRADVRDNAFYEKLAERLSTATAAEAQEDAMSRGVRLEDEAISEFERRTGKGTERVGFVESSFSSWSGYSPDAIVVPKGRRKASGYEEDVEVKCLFSTNHVRAWITGRIPPEHEAQAIQAFVVNPRLKRRHFVFYDPRIAAMPYVCIVVERSGVEGRIEEARKAQIDFIKRVDAMVASLVKI